jgi:hypothetical protein
MLVPITSRHTSRSSTCNCLGGAFQIGAGCGLTVAPFLGFVGAAALFGDLVLGLRREECAVGEIGFRGFGVVEVNWGSGVFRDLGHHVPGVDVVFHAGGVFHGDVEAADDQRGPLHVDGVAHQGVDDFHQGVLDRLFVFDQRDGMEARLFGTADAAVGVLVEVAELLSAESGGAATDSGDFDMSA